MTGTFIDTIVVCTMTGLTIVLTGSDVGLEGVARHHAGLSAGAAPCPGRSALLLMICLVFFGFTHHSRLGLLQRALSGIPLQQTRLGHSDFPLALYSGRPGPFLTVQAVWTIADIFNALMAVPNLIAVLALSEWSRPRPGRAA